MALWVVFIVFRGHSWWCPETICDARNILVIKRPELCLSFLNQMALVSALLNFAGKNGDFRKETNCVDFSFRVRVLVSVSVFQTKINHYLRALR